MKVSELLVDAKLTNTKADAKRLIKAGAVEINGKRITIDEKVVFVR